MGFGGAGLAPGGKLQEIAGVSPTFRILAGDLPVGCKLLAPAAGTQIVHVGVLSGSANAPTIHQTIAGLPGTAFTLPALAPGTYDVFVYVNPSTNVDVVEDSAAQTVLLSFFPPLPRLDFKLVVA